MTPCPPTATQMTPSSATTPRIRSFLRLRHHKPMHATLPPSSAPNLNEETRRPPPRKNEWNSDSPNATATTPVHHERHQPAHSPTPEPRRYRRLLHLCIGVRQYNILIAHNLPIAFGEEDGGWTVAHLLGRLRHPRERRHAPNEPLRHPPPRPRARLVAEVLPRDGVLGMAPGSRGACEMSSVREIEVIEVGGSVEREEEREGRSRVGAGGRGAGGPRPPMPQDRGCEGRSRGSDASSPTAWLPAPPPCKTSSSPQNSNI